MASRLVSGGGKRGARAAGTARAVQPVALRRPADGTEDDWVEPDEGEGRLEAGAVEMLLTGHAATRGDEGDEDWVHERIRHDLD